VPVLFRQPDLRRQGPFGLGRSTHDQPKAHCQGPELVIPQLTRLVTGSEMGLEGALAVSQSEQINAQSHLRIMSNKKRDSVTRLTLLGGNMAETLDRLISCSSL
jgi:hypothetical protein